MDITSAPVRRSTHRIDQRAAAWLSVLLVLVVATTTVAPSPTAVAAPPTSSSSPNVTGGSRTATGSWSSDAAALRITSPSANALVLGRPLTVRVSMAAVPSSFEVRTDEGRVTSSFHRIGREMVGLIANVPAGTNTVEVKATIAGKVERALVSITVKGQRRDLLSFGSAAPLSAALGGAADSGGVKVLALRTEPGSTVSAQLNHAPVTLPPAGAGSIRQLVLSTGDGLRSGDNTFVATAFRPDGAWEQLTARFVVPAGALLTEAGRRTQIWAGASVTLNADPSLQSASGAPAASRLRRHYRWQLLSGPGVATPVTISTASATRYRLSRAGEYLFRVTVSERRASGITTSADLVTVTAAAAVPAIGAQFEVDPPRGEDTTRAGVQVGGTRWAWSSYEKQNPDAKAAVVAIDPVTLQAPTGFGVPVKPTLLPSTDPDTNLQTYLDGVPQGAIIVVMGADGCCAQSKVLPHRGPFSHVFAYSGKGLGNISDDGSWNRGQNFTDVTGDVLAEGVLAGRLRWQAGAADATKQITGAGYRFVQDSNIRYATQVNSVATTAPNDGAIYRLLDPSQTQALAGPAEGRGPAMMQPRSSGLGQQWKMVRGYGDYYELVNSGTGQCLNLSGSDGKTVLQYPCSGLHQSNELWIPLRQTDGTWLLESAASDAPAQLTRAADGIGLTVVKNSSDLATKWRFDVAPGTYTMTVLATGQAMAEPDYGTSPDTGVVVADATSELSQQWQLIDRGPGVFAVKDLASAMCLTAPAIPDALAVRRSCTPDDVDQRWSVTNDAQGVHLHHDGSALLLTRRLGSSSDNALVVRDADPISPAPAWVLSRQPEPVANGYYSLTTPDEGLALIDDDHDESGAHAADFAKAGDPDPTQDWLLRPSEDDRSDTYQLQNNRSGKCLARLFSDSYLTNLTTMVDCAGAARSGWQLSHADDGTIRVVQPDTNRSLTLNTWDEVGRVEVRPPGDLLPTGQPWLLSSRSSTFDVGGHDFTASLPAGGSGFAVLATDETARPLRGYPKVYLPYGPSANAMAADLTALGTTAGRTVLVQSVGRPKPSAVFNSIGDGLDRIGGDKGSLLAMNGTGDIAIAGCSGCHLQPVYSETAHRSADARDLVVGARLEGTMERDADGTLVPRRGTIARIDDTLFDLATRPTSAWPFDETDGNGTLDDPVGHAIVEAFGNKLSSSLPDTCPGAPDRVRRAYCAAAGTDVSLEPDSLDEVTDAQIMADVPGATGPKIDEVRDTLKVEFHQVSRVSTLITKQSGLYKDALLASADNSSAQIAQKIKDNLPASVDKVEAGGVLEVLTQALEIIKVVAVVGNAPPAAGEDTEWGDLVVHGIGFAAAAFDLAGSNDDGSDGVSEQLDTRALEYAGELDNQNTALINNFTSVLNVLVSDPVKLRIAAANSSGTWAEVGSGTPNDLPTLLHNALTANLWVTLLPVGYEMWQWPSLPAGTTPTQIACQAPPYDSGTLYLLYPKQDPRGVFQPPALLAPDGTVAARRTLMLSVAGQPNAIPGARKNNDRSLPAALAEEFYDGSGLVAEDVVRTVDWTRRNYPKDIQVRNENDCMLLVSSGHTKKFGPKYY